MRPRIALLNAAHDPANNRRNFRREVDATLVEFHVPSGEMPSTFDFEGCIVTGSRASVYWDEPWIGELKAWVGEATDRGMPTLGVCFGHQLIAEVLGGQVEPMDEYEIGYREVTTSGDSVLFDGIDRSCTVFTTHSDRVSQLPPGAELIAANDYGIHGLRSGDVFSVQFHPEYDTETAREVTLGKDDQLDDEVIERVLDGITPATYREACEAKTLFDNFTAYVESHQSTTTATAGVGADD